MNYNLVRILGFTGSVFGLISLVILHEALAYFISIVGAIFVLIATKILSDITGIKDIFINYLYATILGIITLLIVIILTALFFGTIEGIILWDIETLISIFGISLVLIYLLIVGSCFFTKRCFYLIAEHTNTKLFRTTGLLGFIGGILTIILIGFIILFVAEVLSAIAFLSLKEKK